MKKTSLPLVAVSYLQTLANANPKMVSQASSFLYALKDQYDQKKISEKTYLDKIVAFINGQTKAS